VLNAKYFRILDENALMVLHSLCVGVCSFVVMYGCCTHARYLLKVEDTNSPTYLVWDKQRLERPKN